ncbi:hypothetical protein [Chlorogloea sp. CCALA 695]|uniref:hypothetical protein n=1 Tax=Chlorogloea sp. CCALA 695 TaxID=2107693 RepID=UPI000D08157A|nr:hypothetical protein [Chlorogloea sp. CCALA 695]PSB30625.1 hypothetical protein C7B70_15815 [Chlorogloea sp. CCALA 695]
MVSLTQSNVDFYSELSPAEQWFECFAHSLSLLAPTLDLSQVQTALETHLSQRVERVLPRLANIEDPEQWLSLILKANFLIRLWRTKDEPVVVAMNVSGGHLIPQSQHEMIKSPEFSKARKDLGISKHWCLTIQNLEQAPSKDELLDILYAQLDSESECGVIDLG